MDKKFKNALEILSNASETKFLKEVGITATQAKLLEQLDLVKLSIVTAKNSKTTPKTPNAIVITDLGLNFVKILENKRNQQFIKTEKQFIDFYKIITETHAKLDDIKSEITSLENLTEILVMEVVKNHITGFKQVVEIPIVVEELITRTHASIKEIHKFIYQLYIKNKINLQVGKSMKGIPLQADDGTNFYYITIIN